MFTVANEMHLYAVVILRVCNVGFDYLCYYVATNLRYRIYCTLKEKNLFKSRLCCDVSAKNKVSCLNILTHICCRTTTSNTHLVPQ